MQSFPCLQLFHALTALAPDSLCSARMRLVHVCSTQQAVIQIGTRCSQCWSLMRLLLQCRPQREGSVALASWSSCWLLALHPSFRARIQAMADGSTESPTQLQPQSFESMPGQRWFARTSKMIDRTENKYAAHVLDSASLLSLGGIGPLDNLKLAGLAKPHEPTVQEFVVGATVKFGPHIAIFSPTLTWQPTRTPWFLEDDFCLSGSCYIGLRLKGGKWIGSLLQGFLFVLLATSWSTSRLKEAKLSKAGIREVFFPGRHRKHPEHLVWHSAEGVAC